jgi:hypothetical protein
MSFLDSAASYSSLIAPAIDRTAISVHAAIDKQQVSDLRGEHRFAPQALSLFAAPLAAGPITATEFAEMSRYQHFGSMAPFVLGLAERGAIEIDDAGSLIPTADGQSVARQLVALQAATVDALWVPCAPSLPIIRSLMDAAVAKAKADPMSILAPFTGRAWLPEGASDGAHVWNNAVILRMHRADAHAAAWKEAGKDAAEMRAMGPTAERAAIEERTNELAATPWMALDSDERLALLAGLAALPGIGAPIA